MDNLIYSTAINLAKSIILYILKIVLFFSFPESPLPLPILDVQALTHVYGS